MTFFSPEKGNLPNLLLPILPSRVNSILQRIEKQCIIGVGIFTGQIGQKQIGQIHFVGIKIDRKIGGSNMWYKEKITMSLTKKTKNAAITFVVSELIRNFVAKINAYDRKRT